MGTVNAQHSLIRQGDGDLHFFAPTRFLRNGFSFVAAAETAPGVPGWSDPRNASILGPMSSPRAMPICPAKGLTSFGRRSLMGPERISPAAWPTDGVPPRPGIVGSVILMF